jgi:hypothetical protein
MAVQKASATFDRVGDAGSIPVCRPKRPRGHQIHITFLLFFEEGFMPSFLLVVFPFPLTLFLL